jgi:hypothetical protein
VPPIGICLGHVARVGEPRGDDGSRCDALQEAQADELEQRLYLAQQGSGDGEEQ